MTAVDEWDDVSTVVDDFRRDQYNRPLILQPDGTRIGYTRSSTASKTIEDTYNLERWGRRNIAFGMAYDTSLGARLIALGGNPGTWDKAQKDVVHKILEDADKIAQAHKGADIGTALHHLTHRLDRGEHVDAGPYAADLEAYRQAMKAHGLRTYPDLIECRIVNDLLKMAGSVDRIAYDYNAEQHRIADIKTGATVDFGGLGWAAQLAAYAGGQLYDVTTEQRLPTPPIDQTVGYIIHLPAGQGRCDIYEIDLVAGHKAAELANQIRQIRKEAKNWLVPKSTWCAAPPAEGQPGGEGPANTPPPTSAAPVPITVEQQAGEGSQIPSPAHICQAIGCNRPADWAYIGHGDDIYLCEFHGGSEEDVDGWTRITPTQVAAPSVSIAGVERPAGEETADPSPAKTAAATDAPPSAARPAPTPVPAGVGASTATPDVDESALRRQGLLNRYHALSELDQKRFDAHKPAFPDPALGVPLPQYFDAVEAVLDEIERTANRTHRADGWDDDDTNTEPVRPTPPPDEGDLMPDKWIGILKQRYNELPTEAKNWIADLIAEGHHANVPWNTGTLHSERRYQLGRAVVALAGAGYLPGTSDPDSWAYELDIDGVTSHWLDEAIQSSVSPLEVMPLGAAIGSLNHTEATQFAHLVDEYLTPEGAA